MIQKSLCLFHHPAYTYADDEDKYGYSNMAPVPEYQYFQNCYSDNGGGGGGGDKGISIRRWVKNVPACLDGSILKFLSSRSHMPLIRTPIACNFVSFFYQLRGPSRL